MKAAGIDPAIVFAFERTGRLVTADNQHLIPEKDLRVWDKAIREYEIKAVDHPRHARSDSSRGVRPMAKSQAIEQVYRLKITLLGVEPPVWRRVEVKDCTLATLHRVVQAVMGWTDSHMHSFEAGGEEYGPPDPTGEMDVKSEAKAKLSRVAAGGGAFSYTYDFGDNWEHDIEVEAVVDAEAKARYPRCLAGERACPPDDCGGPWGYPDFLAIVSDPKHPEHEELLEWAGGAFDPEKFSVEAVNKDLRAIQ